MFNPTQPAPAIKRSVVRVFHTPTQQQPASEPNIARPFDAVYAGKSFSNPPCHGAKPAGGAKSSTLFPVAVGEAKA